MLLDLVESLGGRCELAGAGPLIRGVRLDSRGVQPGDLFVALRGESADGRAFIPSALAAGASAVLVEEPPAGELATQLGEVPVWVHPAARAVAGRAAARVEGDPSRAMTVIGVTGTNGKTTTAHLIGELLRACGREPAVLGTTGHQLAGGRRVVATHTTPDAPELQRLLATHRAHGGDSVVLEVSSHALLQDRVTGTEMDIAVYTNLSRDHLDYHGDMQHYAAAKSLMFSTLQDDAVAILNQDDAWFENMAVAARKSGARIITYSTESQADLRASELRIGPDALQLTLSGMGISLARLRLPLSGRFNVSNALAASAAVLMSGASPGAVVTGLASVSSPPGRLERVPLGAGAPTVLVDYAHTPDALRGALGALRESLPEDGARLLVVFGCGGDRDAGKRPEMGAAAAAFADALFVTSDNPRSEDPQGILDEILVGVPAGTDAVALVDRRAAIHAALRACGPKDVVLVAGKGHETVQIGRDGARPFDDRLVVQEEWA